MLVCTTDQERRLLRALASMCAQYLGEIDNPHLDHMYMSAGEEAVELLAAYGLVTPDGRGGKWTASGEALLDES